MSSVAQRKANARYKRSRKGKAANTRYAQSEKGKVVKARIDVKYAQSERGKKANARYNQSEEGKIADARAHARCKELGYNLINNWFPGANGHHINEEDVLFIPEELHQSIAHRLNNLESMKMMNDAVFKWFYAQEEAQQ